LSISLNWHQSGAQNDDIHLHKALETAVGVDLRIRPRAMKMPKEWNSANLTKLTKISLICRYSIKMAWKEKGERRKRMEKWRMITDI